MNSQTMLASTAPVGYLACRSQRKAVSISTASPVPQWRLTVPFEIICPGCEATIPVPNGSHGRRVKSPVCAAVCTVPMPTNLIPVQAQAPVQPPPLATWIPPPLQQDNHTPPAPQRSNRRSPGSRGTTIFPTYSVAIMEFTIGVLVISWPCSPSTHGTARKLSLSFSCSSSLLSSFPGLGASIFLVVDIGRRLHPWTARRSQRP